MKWLAGGVCVLCLLALGFQSPKVDFSGKWKLDLKKSQSLPASFKNVDMYELEIAQTGDSMTVNTTMKGNGQTVNFPRTVYEFNGKETFREDTLRGSKRWMSASWTTTGQKLIVTSRVEQHRQDGQAQKYTQTDVWQYGMRHTLLVIVTQTFEGSDSTHSEHRVYTRMQ